jgi:hypothetical protein
MVTIVTSAYLNMNRVSNALHRAMCHKQFAQSSALEQEIGKDTKLF